MHYPDWYHKVWWAWKEWRFKRKYGISMGDAMKELGRSVQIREIKKAKGENET